MRHSTLQQVMSNHSPTNSDLSRGGAGRAAALAHHGLPARGLPDHKRRALELLYLTSQETNLRMLAPQDN